MTDGFVKVVASPTIFQKILNALIVKNKNLKILFIFQEKIRNLYGSVIVASSEIFPQKIIAINVELPNQKMCNILQTKCIQKKIDGFVYAAI